MRVVFYPVTFIVRGWNDIDTKRIIKEEYNGKGNFLWARFN